MKLNGDRIKRLVIYFFYDMDGIVDSYIPYMLEDLKKNCSDLFIVCNGKLSAEGRKTFNSFTSNLLVRDNVGFDVWAYKEAMATYGWEKLSEFDEVIMMNFTIMGPLYPFAEMFEVMDKRDIDFWGITKYHKVDNDPFGNIVYGYIPDHIQSHFIAVRKNMLNSREFHDYWDFHPEVKNYSDAVGLHEAIFTKKFEDYGFVSDVYVDTEDLKPVTYYPLLARPKELIQDRRCPIFKRRSFFSDYLHLYSESVGNASVDLFNYISKHTDYDVNLIWDNILRVNNMDDIRKMLHLNYILPGNTSINKYDSQRYRTALFMHLYFEDQVDYCLNYAKSMPENADIYFTVCSSKIKKLVKKSVDKLSPRKVQIIGIENRGRDVSALLVGAAPYVNDYDFVCFMHDKKVTQLQPATVGMGFRDKCFENNLGSADYVNNVITTFANNPRLGLLMPPVPNHSAFNYRVVDGWSGNYERVVELAKKLDLSVDISRDKDPIAPLGTEFWFRPKAMKKLFDVNWKYTDFPEEPNGCDGTILHAIERCYGFVCQDAGYYSAYGMIDSFAAIEFTNVNFMLKEACASINCMFGYPVDLIWLMCHRRDNNLPSVCFGENKITNRILMKNIIKEKVPKPIWKCCRKIYHIFGGKKWLG